MNAWPLMIHRVRPSSRDAVVVDGKAGFLERLQIAPDRARRDAALRGEVVDRDACAARAFDLAKDRPLPDDFRVSRHTQILIAELQNCRKEGNKERYESKVTQATPSTFHFLQSCNPAILQFLRRRSS